MPPTVAVNIHHQEVIFWLITNWWDIILLFLLKMGLIDMSDGHIAPLLVQSAYIIVLSSPWQFSFLFFLPNVPCASFGISFGFLGPSAVQRQDTICWVVLHCWVCRQVYFSGAKDKLICLKTIQWPLPHKAPTPSCHLAPWFVSSGALGPVPAATPNHYVNLISQSAV